jgi:hypothetical protein
MTATPILCAFRRLGGVASLIVVLSGLPILADSLQVADSASPNPISEMANRAGAPGPVTQLTVFDHPNDDGSAVGLGWTASPDDFKGGSVRKYRIYRCPADSGVDGPFAEVGDVTAGITRFTDGNCAVGQSYYYKVRAVADSVVDGRVIFEGYSESGVAGPVTAVAQWFDWQRRFVFIGVLVLCFLIMYYIRQAQAGKSLFIRKIAGLEAVDEAVGRATEMGKKIFYIPGSQDMDNVQTIAGVTILGRVAEMAATYDAKLEVPVSRSLVMVTAREIVKEAYSKAGRPDAFQENQVHYLTDDQFGYAAAVDGKIVREKPATIFLLGIFYAESLILSETGNSVGAIQIAGTGEPSQLPFFVAACDYTLIGEELFAASAYLSREPRQLGSLKGQDVGKGIIIGLILIGIILETFGIYKFSELFSVIE